MGKIKGYAALYAAATLFAFTGIAVKLASARFHVYLVSGLRCGIGAALCLAVLVVFYRGYRPRNVKFLVLRGAVGALSMAMSYAAIALTGPGRAVLLSNTYPLFVALFGAAFFGEPLRARTAGSLALCIAGAALVVRDGSGASVAGDLLALASAVAAGFAVNCVRRLGSTENPFAIYLSPCLFGLAIFAVAPLPSVPPDLGGMALVAAVGVGAFAAQALMAVGYRSVPAGTGSVVFYWETVLTLVLGAALAGETFNARFAAGFAAIVAGLVLNQLPARRRAG